MTLPSRSSGFTLIEILLVMTILGVLSGMLMLTAPHNQARSLESEVRAFQSLLEQTSAAAVRNSEHYGIILGSGDWQLMQFDSRHSRRNGWLPIAWENIGSIHPHYAWSADSQARLIEVADISRRNTRGQGVVKPDVIVYANGELSSFTIEISAMQDRALRYQLQSDGLNIHLVGD
ncbi:MAG: type II secretion system protein [Pseudomonadales bacterium]